MNELKPNCRITAQHILLTDTYLHNMLGVSECSLHPENLKKDYANNILHTRKNCTVCDCHNQTYKETLVVYGLEYDGVLYVYCISSWMGYCTFYSCTCRLFQGKGVFSFRLYRYVNHQRDGFQAILIWNLGYGWCALVKNIFQKKLFLMIVIIHPSRSGI